MLGTLTNRINYTKPINTVNKSNFYKYLEETENTICGRHPIGILLNVKLNVISYLLILIIKDY